MVPPRSTFVTVLAWIFIVLAGFATCISILQNVMIAFVFPAAEMEAAAEQLKGQAGTPWFAVLMARYFRYFFLLFLLMSVTTLTAAIGLLRRKNWARLLFVALMGFGILWQVAGLVFMFFMLGSLDDFAGPANQPGTREFEIMFKVMMGVNVVFVAAFTTLFAWIIKRLVSEDIRREFATAEGMGRGAR